MENAGALHAFDRADHSKPGPKRKPKMRMIAFVLAAAAVSGPAVAQSWQEYRYPEYAFSVVFPATPKVENTTYQAADGRSLPARVYSVAQNNELFKFTIADLANTGLDEKAVIDHAIKTLSAGGQVTFNIPQRIYNVYGRSLGIQGGDGSRSTVGVFDYKSRLYQIEAKALPEGNANAADILRFQQSQSSNHLCPASQCSLCTLGCGNRVGGFLAVPPSHTTERTHRTRRFPADCNAV
jgi:hypothetical protein